VPNSVNFLCLLSFYDLICAKHFSFLEAQEKIYYFFSVEWLLLKNQQLNQVINYLVASVRVTDSSVCKSCLVVS
jgi:hypothetical protein